jgi:uncharacterized membrane protein YjdF
MERGAPDRKVRSFLFAACILRLVFQERIMGFLAVLSLLGLAAIFGLVAWLSFKVKKSGGE